MTLPYASSTAGQAVAADPPGDNLRAECASPTERLFYSTAFVRGFSDHRAGRPLSCPDDVRGPNPHRRSAELAYERGRLFAAHWGARPITDLTAMKEELDRLHKLRWVT